MTPYYNKDGITIYHGNCLEILPTITSGIASLTVTSPPYNLKKKWWGSGANGCHVALAEKFATQWYDDEIDEDEYQEQQKSVIAECFRITDGAVCYNHKVRHAFKREGRTFHPMDWINSKNLWCEIIWDKGNGTAINCRRPIMADERIYVIGRPSAWSNERHTTVWRIPMGDMDETGHPCAFPIEIPSRLIRIFSPAGSMILDPYMGSGTTLRAAKDNGCRAIGIEICEAYCEIAANRLAQGVFDFEASQDGNK